MNINIIGENKINIDRTLKLIYVINPIIYIRKILKIYIYN